MLALAFFELASLALSASQMSTWIRWSALFRLVEPLTQASVNLIQPRIQGMLQRKEMSSEATSSISISVTKQKKLPSVLL
jgi:hypothetical protein